MKLALIQAKKSFYSNEVPIGAIVVNNNEVIGEGRNRVIELNANKKVNYYSLESENFESIHNHSAYALITNQK